MRTSFNRSLTLLACFLLLAASFLVFESCRKMDRPKDDIPDLLRSKFFNIKAGTDPLVIAIASSVKRQDEQRNLVPKLTGKAGFPAWGKAKISRPGRADISGRIDETAHVFIPFVQDDEQQTKAILAVKLQGEDTLYSMIYGKRYAGYGFDSSANDGSWNASELFTAFALFDHDIYGHDEFYLKDSRILGAAADTFGSFSANIKIEEIDNEYSGRLQNPSGTIRVLVTFVICITDPEARMASNSSGRFPNPCYNASYYSDVVTFNLDENIPGGGFFDQGGGGGDGTDLCPGCSWEDTNPCEQQDPNQPQGFCDDGWTPTFHAQPENFDPYRYDSVKISSEIEDSFPCVYKIISEDLYDINKLTQIGMHDIFTVNQYNHTYFKLDYSLCGTNKTGAANPFPKKIMINGQQHFIDTISLNPCWLEKASRESVVATIVHETIHAYILWCISDYRRYGGWQQGYTVTAEYLQEKFPLHWQKMVNEPWNDTLQHAAMAAGFIDYMADVIYTWGNPNAPMELRQWVAKTLAKGGLQETSAWGHAPGLTDTCTINQVIQWGRKFHDVPGMATGFNGGAPCRTTYYSFRDSLQMVRADSCQ